MGGNSIQGEVFFQDHKERLSRFDETAWLVRAAGKINLTLSVGPKRSDGYHDFESLMATITLYDDILLRMGPDSINLTCNDPSLPAGSDNLVYRACSLLSSQSDTDADVDIELVKRIPTQAGLGGGSADAAATLLGLNELWKLNWPTEELSKLAAMLGSDVGFFLAGPLAVCTGRGEIVKPLDFVWNFWVVVIKPKIALSTAEVYKHYVRKDNATFARADSLVKLLPKSKPSQIYSYLENDLETPAFRITGELGSLRKNLQKLLNVPVRLSGSGSAMFAIFDDREQAQSALHRIQSSYTELTCWLGKNNVW
ncbi:MAG: 4-(cytidine 5'-diphospho)-2-C-methyl-D-erythritol kinase [Phycisphaerae bacterium]